MSDSGEDSKHPPAPSRVSGGVAVRGFQVIFLIYYELRSLGALAELFDALPVLRTALPTLQVAEETGRTIHLQQEDDSISSTGTWQTVSWMQVGD